MVSAGGESISALVSGSADSSGGLEVVSAGTASATTISGAGAFMFVFSGGLASDTVVAGNDLSNYDGGGLVLFSGGTASGTTLGSSGLEVLSSGGIAVNTTIGSGGLELDLVGGTTSNTAVSSGGTLVVDGVADPTTIYFGGSEIISSGGADSGAIISSGGTEIVSSGGTAIDATVYTGGLLDILAGGNAIGTINDGGTIDGGYTGTTVGSGQIYIVSSGQTDVGDIILSGGTEIVLSAGVTSDATINSGGQIIVSIGRRSNLSPDH